MPDRARLLSDDPHYSIRPGIRNGKNPRATYPDSYGLTNGGSPQIPVLIGVAFAAVFLVSPRAGDLLGALVGMAAFVFIQAAWPQCRFHRDVVLLCPANLAQVLFALQLLLVPLLMSYGQVYRATLPQLPSYTTIDTVFLIQALAYVSFCAGYRYLILRTASCADRDLATAQSFCHRLRRPPSLRFQSKLSHPTSEALTFLKSPVAPLLAVIYAAAGVAGFLLYFHGPEGFLAYAMNSAQFQAGLDPYGHASLAEAAGNVMRPFLSWAIVIAWSIWVQRYASALAPIRTVMLTGLTLLLLVGANFSYNRGMMVAPVLALVAAFSLRVRRIPVPMLLTAGVVLFFLAMIFGSARANGTQLQSLTSPQMLSTLTPTGNATSDFLQQYLNAPQFGAYLLDNTGDGSSLYFGQTLGASLLYPIPILGRSFRPYSGTAIFNTAIYRRSDIVDQNVPFSAELFINFHLIGIIAGFCLLGVAAAYTQRRTESCHDPLPAFGWSLVAIWLLFMIPGSLSVTAQICIFFFWPMYIYVLAEHLLLGTKGLKTRDAAFALRRRIVVHRT